MDKYIIEFENLCDKLEKSEEQLIEKQKQAFFLNGI